MRCPTKSSALRRRNRSRRSACTMWTSPRPRTARSRSYSRRPKSGATGIVRKAGLREALPLLRRIAAIDDRFGAGDELGLLGNKIENGISDIVGLADMTDRMRRIGHLASFREIAQRLQMVLDHRRPDIGRMHRVDANP